MNWTVNDTIKKYPDLLPVFHLEGLTAAQKQALTKIGIHSLGDLQRYNPFHYARLIQAAYNKEFDEEVRTRQFVDFMLEQASLEELIHSSVEILEGIGPAKAKLFKFNFDLHTVEDLANASLFKEAIQLL